ncbi:hypothetical protein HOL59_06245 [Candidatus Woesearchaeota archaeon]|jgi:hypothetical protein|nr:hypothetical protein [Candidatus Woesearchaeota archaeon]
MDEDNSLEGHIYQHYFTQGIGDGVMVGFDPVGSLYAKIAQQPDLTIGGINLQRKFNDSLGYKVSKGLGFAFGITTNVLAHGLPQVAMAVANLDYILSSTSKKDD